MAFTVNKTSGKAELSPDMIKIFVTFACLIDFCLLLSTIQIKLVQKSFYKRRAMRVRRQIGVCALS